MKAGKLVAKNYGFMGRVSTEDQQDPTSSRAWQLSRAEALIQPHGGVIVAEYFDIGQSRSLPWKRRPEAARLLEDLRDPGRGFDAVVIGEPARAFYGSQFGEIFPIFKHFGVELWVPEVGGRIEPDSDAHELVMSLYGGMSKGERNRIKIRVKTAMSAQTKIEGRFLGGRPPYGYQLAVAGPHPNPGKAALGLRVHELEPDPETAPIVRRIFEEYAAGKGVSAIAEGLVADGIISPSAHDPKRNRHRMNANGAWSKRAVCSILDNPRYTGRQVWNRQRRDEVLIDIEDVALGYETKMRWNNEDDWVWSNKAVHEPLIPVELFEEVHQQRSVSKRKVLSTPRRKNVYALSGLLICGVCNRRMNGVWTHDRPYYRCQFPKNYAIVKGTHVNNVYVKEEDILPHLDEWLSSVFDPENADQTFANMLRSEHEIDSDTLMTKVTSARKSIAECERKLKQYRGALDSGADPAVVTKWIADVEIERLRAEAILANAGTKKSSLNEAEVRALVNQLFDLVCVLRNTDRETKGKLYQELGVLLTYQPETKKVLVESHPLAYSGRVGERT